MVGCSNYQPASTGERTPDFERSINRSWKYGRRRFLNRMICKGYEHFCAKVKMLTLHCGVESQRLVDS